jgi:hypothetical protein
MKKTTAVMAIVAIAATSVLAVATFAVVVPQLQVVGLPVLLHYTCQNNPGYSLGGERDHPCGSGILPPHP